VLQSCFASVPHVRRVRRCVPCRRHDYTAGVPSSRQGRAPRAAATAFSPNRCLFAVPRSACRARIGRRRPARHTGKYRPDVARRPAHPPDRSASNSESVARVMPAVSLEVERSKLGVGS
jgi:hypothetical protein